MTFLRPLPLRAKGNGRWISQSRFQILESEIPGLLYPSIPY
jgi:hypothetical protein